ncbi:MAG: sulfatase-like hydrolase/transferase [Tissierellia bacterium]|nr:sulfatase-like hydrolase/transferase [Tissierellia bacterium]
MKKRLLLLLLVLFLASHRIGAEDINTERTTKEQWEEKSSQEEEYFSLGSLRYEFLFDKLHDINDGTGKAKNHHLLLVRVGGLKSLFLSEAMDGMPALRQWSKEKGKRFMPHCVPLVGADPNDDGEFVTFHSLYPYDKKSSMEQYEGEGLYGLAKIASHHGYSASAYLHHPKNKKRKERFFPEMGFEKMVLCSDPTQGVDDFLSDVLSSLQQKSKSFSYVSVDLFGEHMPWEFRKSSADDRKEMVRQELEAMDRSLVQFLRKVEEKAEDTLIVLYGDYGPVEDGIFTQLMGSLPGLETISDDLPERMVFPLFFSMGTKEKAESDESLCSSLDVLPSILNLMGWNEEVVPLFGRDLFSKSSGQERVYLQRPLPKGTYVYRRKTADGMELAVGARENMEFYQEAHRQIDLCQGLLERGTVKEFIEMKQRGGEMMLHPKYTITHAGGELCGMTYTNMKEALDENYDRGKRIFEVDIETTADGKGVCLHSWDGFVYKFFKKEPHRLLTKSEFMDAEEVHGFTQMDLNLLIQWFQEHEDAILVTDSKRNTIQTLTYIKEKAPELLDRIWPQIYAQEEYLPVKQLGYENIIYTLYMSGDSDEEVSSFAKDHPLRAVTMEKRRYDGGLGKLLIDQGIRVFVHTINDRTQATELLNQGVKGIYSDRL